MAKISVRPSDREDSYPNGGHEAYWMGRIAQAMSSQLEKLQIDLAEEGREEGCGLFLTLRSHAAPREVEAKIKGAEVYYYEYSPAGKRAADIFTGAIKSVYPQPQLVESIATPAPEELRAAPAPALVIKLGYHDNPQDEAWLVNGVEEIAAALAHAAADFLGVSHG